MSHLEDNLSNTEQQVKHVTELVGTLEQLKKERTNARKEVTRWTKEIERTVQARGSRRYIHILIKKVTVANDRAKSITDVVAENVSESEAEAEYNRQMEYTSKAEDAREVAEQYLEDRKDDDPSEAASQTGQEPPATEVPEREEKLLRVSIPTREEVNGTETERLNQPTGRVSFDHQSRLLRRPDVEEWRKRSIQSQQAQQDEAPDDWITEYVQGRDHPYAWASYNSHSAVKTDLEPYDGSALKWFCWIGLFKSLVHDTGKAAGEKLALLRRSLRGDCLDIVYGLGGGEAAYKEALIRLRETCGRRDVMRAAHLQALEKLDPGRGNPSLLKRYAERVRTHLFDLCSLGERSNFDIIDRICQKLNVQDRLAWNEARVNGGLDTNLKQFGSWLSSRAAAYQNPHDVASEQARASESRGYRQQARTNQASSGQSHDRDQETNKRSCPKCSKEHQLDQCQEFKSLSNGDRLSFVSRSRLCFYCFGRGHPAFKCHRSRECGINGCKKRHHRLLHDNNSGEEADQTARGNSACTSPTQVALGVVRATVCGPNGRKATINILLDEGSDTTLVRDGLLRKLGVDGETKPLKIRGVTGVESRHQSKRVQLQLEGEEGRRFNINASSLPKVCEGVPVIGWSKLQRRWAHLDDLPLSETGGRIDILLGLDHASLLIPTDYRMGEAHEPCAWRTRLGWVVRGPIGDGGSMPARVHLLFGQPDFNLDVEFKRFCETESFGTEHPEPKKALTIDEKRAMEIVDGSTRKLAVGYEVALPWKKGEPDLPDNRPMAEQRLKSLIRRFQRDPGFENEYRTAIEKYVSEGYARKITDPGELADGRFYLPHFGVYKKSARVKKVRVVFDSAAPFRGKALNDALLAGPVLQNQLPAVLIKFREGAFAFSADIEAMFSRIRLREEDAKYHRFLFQDRNSDVVDVYQMDRLTFGDKCSPFVAIHTLRRTVKDYGEGRPEVLKAIVDDTYVDDWLESTKTVEEAIRLAKDVSAVLEKGDFKLRGWVSNSRRFNEEVAAGELSPAQAEVPLGSEEETTSVLGIVWRPSADLLSFCIRPLPERSQTRRGLAGRLASIYDPLGLASPLTIKGKIKLRKLGQTGLHWDDQIDAEEEKWWKQWETEIESLNSFSVPRCFFPDEDSIERRELHTFSDASEEAFASVVYLRCVYPDGRARVNIVMAKTKLAQKKTISVAKLELQAALLGSRLARYVGDALTRQVDKRRFWTDSSCVRNWVRATSAFYKPFVSHRIGEIQLLTETEEWRFVPGKLNPSDAATRSSLELEELVPASWRDGPAFLLQPEIEWPADIPWIVPQEELRSSHEFRVNVTQSQLINWDGICFDPDNIPSYTELKGELLEWLKRCQSEEFAKELKQIEKKGEVKRTSALLELSPVIGEDGLLRVGGRAGRAPLPNENLHPVILPARHPLTSQLIQAFHCKHNHCGTDFVLSHVRDYYWPIRGKEAVKKVARRCPLCIRERARPAIQKMADLPKERLAVYTPPFHHTAVDYFGPLEVAYGRGRSVKRYGALFTCLTTRAVYLDLARSLSTEDFLLVLRRFLSFYSKPQSIHSDNGTNFVGAEKELAAPVNRLNQDPALEEALRRSVIKWKFQPPSAPHFGGAHESLVRVTKLSLYRLLKKEGEKLRYPTEEMMRTLLCEVAAILNDRPLVKCSSDPRDYRPLTPNDLLGKRNGLVLPMTDPKDALPHQSYLYVQRLTNTFWDLWIKFYLPSLFARRKWQLKERNFKVGDHVLVSEPNLPRGRWTTGKVTQTHPGEDGLVRVVMVETESGAYTRPIHRLCLLQPAEDGQKAVCAESASGENGATNSNLPSRS